MLIPLSNTARAYDWGSTTLLADLERRGPAAAPEAEVWFGDHPGAPAHVDDGTGRTLDEWLSREGLAAGAPARLPYLLKLLAAASPLSIQAHPSAAQAAAGFAREEAAGPARDAPGRNYRDASHKPELLVAISPEFVLLSGIREAAATRRLLSALGTGPGVTALRARWGDGDAAGVRRAIGWLLSGDASADVADLVAALQGASSGEFAGELETARAVAARFPGDPGVGVALLMNRVVLRRGEAVFIDAGSPHTYLAGLGVELMAASDNVLRGGFTTKHIDVVELLEVLDASPAPVRRLAPVPVEGARGAVTAFAPGIPDFELLRIAVSAVAPAIVPLRGAAIIVATVGAVHVGEPARELVLTPGRAAFVTADESPLRLSGDGEAFLAQPGA